MLRSGYFSVAHACTSTGVYVGADPGRGGGGGGRWGEGNDHCRTAGNFGEVLIW